MRERRSGAGLKQALAASSLGPRIKAPLRPEHYVRRQRLMALLDDLARHPVILVAAPAGAGKTSLIVDWLGERTVPSAWVSLDVTDRDGQQLWATVTSALGTVVPALDDRASRSAGPRTAVDAVNLLLAGLETAHKPVPTTLVIDELQVVDGEEATIQSLGLFLESMPPWLHVVLLSRRPPALPLARWRSRGQLAEITFAELRFSLDEATSLLQSLAPFLSAGEGARIAARSDGWAAGLQLSALAARSQKAHDELADHDETGLLVSDYVWREVLVAERTEVVDVLTDTAAVSRVNASLAQAMTGRADAGDLLLEAEARGLFVSRLDPLGWFEVHAVIRDVLLAEAERRHPQSVAGQHAHAARWYEDSGDVATALRHWVLADQPREALRLLAAEAARLYDAGATSVISDTIAGIPRHVAMADIESQVEYSWCLLLVDRRRFLEGVQQLSESSPPNEIGDAVRQRLRVLESIAFTITGDWARGRRRAVAAAEQLGSDAWRDPIARVAWNMAVRDAALSERWDDASPEIRRARVQMSRDLERTLAFEVTRALGHALAGRPVEALRIASDASSVTDVANLSVLRGELSVAEAIAHRELGDRARAVAQLLPLSEAPVGPVTYSQVLALMELTQARLDEGEIEAAGRAFDRVTEVIQADFFGPGGIAWLSRTGTVVALASGDTELAERWSNRVEDPFWSGVSRARVRLAADDKAGATELLAVATPRCPRHEVVLDLLRARAADTEQESLKSVVQAVERSISTGLLQTVASEGPEVMHLLERSAWVAPKSWLDRVRQAVAHLPPDNVSMLPAVDALTERELDVLRMLPSRLTVPEIAAELSMSANTVKFHLKLIYRKLGVRSRAEAAQVARATSHIRRRS